MSHPMDSPGGIRGTPLVDLGALAKAAVSAEGALTPDTIVALSARAMPSTEHAALTLLRACRTPTTLAASDELPLKVDRLQYRFGDGPCLDAANGTPVLATGDLAVDSRWPDFGPCCVRETSVHSMLSVRLPLGGTDRAALNYYAQECDAFTPDDVATAAAWVPFAALAVEAQLREHDVHHLRVALETNRTISTAVGILMARHHLDADEAFDVLRQVSMRTNTKLRDVSVEVQLTGALPEVPARRPRERHPE